MDSSAVPDSSAPVSHAEPDYSAPPALRKSNALHRRVLEFARAHAGSTVLPRDSFDSLALEIARFQLEHCAGFARLCPYTARDLNHLSQLPVVPTDVFRLSRVALHPPELDEAVFRTSGTTNEMTGRHPVRLLSTKEELTLLQAGRTLFSEYGRGLVVALAHAPDGTSSLGHMMELFIRHFDGRPLLTDPSGAQLPPSEAGRYLISPAGVDLEGLRRAARLARHRAEPFYLLATSFAMVAALDALDGERIKCPSRSKIMITGGFKGRSREIGEQELRTAVADCFCIDERSIVGEYGMTELGSQLFEQQPLRGDLDQRAPVGDARAPNLGPWYSWSAPAGTYFPPPWLRVTPVAQDSYQPVPHGQVGLAHFIDLANIDSCVSFVTQDRIRSEGQGIVLLGRSAEAPVRGCSLPFEAMAFSSGH